GLQVRQGLRREGLVHLDQIEVRELEPGAVERRRGGVGRSLQELVAGGERGEGPGADVGKRRVAQRLRLLLAHQEDGGAAIRQRRRVAGRQAAVVAVEDRLELLESGERGVGTDAV